MRTFGDERSIINKILIMISDGLMGKIYLPLYRLEEFHPATSKPVIARNMHREE
jgi:hypothetical protein